MKPTESVYLKYLIEEYMNYETCINVYVSTYLNKVYLDIRTGVNCGSISDPLLLSNVRNSTVDVHCFITELCGLRGFARRFVAIIFAQNVGNSP